MNVDKRRFKKWKEINASRSILSKKHFSFYILQRFLFRWRT